MEGDSNGVLGSWPSKCKVSLVSLDPNATKPNPDIYEGEQSLFVTGGKCFVFRQLGSDCWKSRLREDISFGDTIRISLMVKLSNPNTVFQMYSAHYHVNKTRRWSLPSDDSHIISRTLIKNANEWTRIEAIHTVGPDWTFEGKVLTPEKCNHYHVRFRTDRSSATFIMDDVRIEKIEPIQSLDLQRGFITNPNFVQDHKVSPFSFNMTFIVRHQSKFWF